MWFWEDEVRRGSQIRPGASLLLRQDQGDYGEDAGAVRSRQLLGTSRLESNLVVGR
jgi:hypothetical protein